MYGICGLIEKEGFNPSDQLISFAFQKAKMTDELSKLEIFNYNSVKRLLRNKKAKKEAEKAEDFPEVADEDYFKWVSEQNEDT